MWINVIGKQFLNWQLLYERLNTLSTVQRQSVHHTGMAGTAKNSERLVGLGLLIFLVTRVFVAVNKLQDEKVATITTKKYEYRRLFPSLSICFRRKINGNLSDNPDHALNISR